MFTTKRNRDYITLFYHGKFVCNCDNYKEVEEEKQKLTNNNIKQLLDK